MRSTFHLLEVAKRGIVAQQIAINTTGQNISNINTPGYTRQRVNMEASKPLEMPGLSKSTAPGQIGMGVEVTSITRVRDIFLDVQYGIKTICSHNLPSNEKPYGTSRVL